MNFLTGMYVKTKNMVGNLVNNEKGSQTLEWLGIAAVIVILVGLVSQAIGSEGLGSTIVGKFGDFIDDIGG